MSDRDDRPIESIIYHCVSGYIIDVRGAYEIGDEIPGIGPVQSLEEVDK